MVYQLGFLVRLFSCPVDERWEVFGNPEEEQIGIAALELTGFPEDFARSMVGNLVTQVRTYSVGARVDDWIWNAIRIWPSSRVKGVLAFGHE